MTWKSARFPACARRYLACGHCVAKPGKDAGEPQVRCLRSEISRPEATAILDRDDESLDHLGVDEVAVELIQLRQPNSQPVQSLSCGSFRIAAQIAERELLLRAPPVASHEFRRRPRST